MIFSKGSIYRKGISLKERGERMAHIRIFGIPVFRCFCGPVIGLGYKLIGLARNVAIGEM